MDASDPRQVGDDPRTRRNVTSRRRPASYPWPMASQSDVRTIALSLPETREEEGHFAFSVLAGKKYKGFAWVWMERVDPRKPRVPRHDVLAVRVANREAKEILLMAEPLRFFTEPDRKSVV